LHLDIKKTDRCLAALPLYHSAQMHVFTMPALLSGAYTCLLDTPTPELILQQLKQKRLNSFFAPPTVWIALLRHPQFVESELQHLQKLYYGASIMPEPIVKELAERLPDSGLYNCYGQSEIAPLATVLTPEEHAERPASCGRPIFNVETRIVDPATGEECAPGQQGELVHRSPQLMVGYWDKPEQTEEAFAGGWFHSGDLGYCDEEGYIWIVDRIKDIVNTGGVLVASRDVEEALYTHPDVDEVAVIGVPDEKWIEAIAAVVVLRPEADPNAESLIRHARENLAPFKVPKHVHFVQQLPKNTSGKLLKRALRQQFSDF
jgi:fatty-acyl-CoA synthase